MGTVRTNGQDITSVSIVANNGLTVHVRKGPCLMVTNADADLFQQGSHAYMTVKSSRRGGIIAGSIIGGGITMCNGQTWIGGELIETDNSTPTVTVPEGVQITNTTGNVVDMR